MDEAAGNRDTINPLIDNVVKYSSVAGGSLAAAIGYRMLSTLVGDIGAGADRNSSSSTTSPSVDFPEEEDEGLPKSASSNSVGAAMSSPKAYSLKKDWFWGRLSGSSSSSTSRQYSSSGFDKEFALPLFTLQEVSKHDTHNDCWMVVYDRVYDVTEFLSLHPGGEDVMLEYAGHDATLAFRGVGHSKEAEESLKPHLIGILVESERIWTRFYNMKSDVP